MPLDVVDGRRPGGGAATVGRMMDEQDARALFEACLRAHEADGCVPLVVMGQHTLRIPQGWVFYYQSKAYVEGDEDAMLIGQGPNIVLDDGRVIEGGSADGSPEAVLRRYGLSL